MARILNNKKINAEKLLQQPSPIILCTDRKDYDDAITTAGYKKISLNLPLAKSIKGTSASMIQFDVFKKIRNILPRTEWVFLTDYEILFDPRYSLDVIRLFSELSPHVKMIIKWCGTVNEETLVYSERGYDDYKCYKISNYDITAIV